MPRPRSLTAGQIADAALAVLDRDGLAGLSMRTVARELGMGTMSLYRYVADREELEALVVDRVLAGVDARVPRGSTRRRLATLADRVRTTVGEHPAVTPLLLANRHRSPGSLRWGETVLGVLADAGVTGVRRVVAFRAVLAYVFGALEIHHFAPLSGAGTAALAGLPAGEFPLLADTASHARGVGADAEFRRGFDILLAGLEL
ncbi:TetR/AcrR family transcriptional regulator [Mycolicibacterium pyrenivorans]|uniref:TetR/AcrR family transcriptional regulator n=1 Tax=Mycolicibacterium pyrenivorans TaxID=187102 RepID=UPI0021F2DA1C|nr:TetR/AcrR family transcriptional regulator C-terminal domain-containing protein [Mycolicibacterium pyrenivorans]MCV7154740.1 TetR/AcrR family transcriptional regulator [Mycolicibacterium pyrenivorans]